jgi:hypothetical protein
MDSARQADQGFDQSALAKPSSVQNEAAELEAHSIDGFLNDGCLVQARTPS